MRVVVVGAGLGRAHRRHRPGRRRLRGRRARGARPRRRPHPRHRGRAGGVGRRRRGVPRRAAHRARRPDRPSSASRPCPPSMDGDSRFLLGRAGGATRHGRFPPLNAVALGEMFELLDELTRTVDPHAPWLTPGRRAARPADRRRVGASNTCAASRRAAVLPAVPRRDDGRRPGRRVDAARGVLPAVRRRHQLPQRVRGRRRRTAGSTAARTRSASCSPTGCPPARSGSASPRSPSETTRRRGSASVHTDRATYDADAVVVAVPPAARRGPRHQPRRCRIRAPRRGPDAAAR